MLKAIKNYNMIENGEKIAVGLSGGKDSITLLYLLAWLQKFSHLHFDLFAIHINTFGNHNNDLLKELCNQLNIRLLTQNLKDSKKIPEKSVCYACARLKRGAMHEICNIENISSLAFGHHATDVAETLLMNMTINKKLGSFCPVVKIPNSKVKIIRPMIYLTESQIIKLHKKFELPNAELKCPYEDKNLRSKYKKALKLLSENLNISDIELKILQSLENIDESNIYGKVKVESGKVRGESGKWKGER
jgi:tRNA(Ile)-lysidine synthase TilS/MesJ